MYALSQCIHRWVVLLEKIYININRMEQNRNKWLQDLLYSAFPARLRPTQNSPECGLLYSLLTLCMSSPLPSGSGPMAGSRGGFDGFDIYLAVFALLIVYCWLVFSVQWNHICDELPQVVVSWICTWSGDLLVQRHDVSVQCFPGTRLRRYCSVFKSRLRPVRVYHYLFIGDFSDNSRNFCRKISSTHFFFSPGFVLS